MLPALSVTLVISFVCPSVVCELSLPTFTTTSCPAVTLAFNVTANVAPVTLFDPDAFVDPEFRMIVAPAVKAISLPHKLDTTIRRLRVVP